MTGTATIASKRRREIYGTTSVYGTHHRAERIRENDPVTGVTVEHLRVVTQTYIDRLHADLKLTDDERDAGQLLADDHYASGLYVASLAVVDPGKPIGGGGSNIDLVRGEEAFARYRDALRSISTYGGRDTLIRACIDEREVRLDWLKAALGELIRYYRRERRKAR